MSLKTTDVRTPGAKAIAQKWNLPLSKVYALISQGARVEFEHNRDREKAKQVARDHLNERPDYYKRLKNMERLPVRMREGLSTEPERDSETIGDYTGSSRKVMKVDEVKLPKVPVKIKSKAKKAVAVGMTAANIATGADIYDRASRGVGSPIRDVVTATAGLPGKVGYAAMGANWTVKGFDKAKEHIKSRQKQINEISAELVGKVSNARFWRKEAPSKTLTRAINKKFIESGKKKEEPKKLVKEGTKMDTKDLINEALDDILENNLVSMKENLMAALQEKAMEKIEEKKKEIASNYFAQ